MSKYVYFKNIYFGNNSVLGLSSNKDKLQDDVDFTITAIAFFLDVADLLNRHALLTHLAYHDGQRLRPILMEWNKPTIIGRSGILLNLAYQFDKSATHFIKNFMDQLDSDEPQIKEIAWHISTLLANRKGLTNTHRMINYRLNSAKSLGIIMPYEKVKKIENSIK
ncbi:MAG: hypothetical protein ACO2ON_01535 [Candidatus Nanopusillus sp.]